MGTPDLSTSVSRLAKNRALRRAVLDWAAVGDHILVDSDGTTYELSASTVIGRRGDCDIVLDGPRVSRRHAQIRDSGDGLLLVDLASVNGTQLNGIEVTSERLIGGDIVTIGEHELHLELG